MAVVADRGYIAAGIGIHAPIKRPRGGQVLATYNQAYNALITAPRAPAERANVLPTGRGHAPDRVTLDPRRITAISQAALVLTSLEQGLGPAARVGDSATMAFRRRNRLRIVCWDGLWTAEQVPPVGAAVPAPRSGS